MFTKEQIEKAATCKSIGELLELAAAEGVQLTRDEAEKYFADLQETEINLDDVKKIVGGVCAANACGQDCSDYENGICIGNC